MRHKLYFIHGIDRKDYLHRAMNSIQEIWDRVVVINNSYTPFEHPVCQVHKPDLNLHCTQMVNLIFKFARDAGCEFFMTMHDDAYCIEPWVIHKFIERVESEFAAKPRLGLIYTNYDALAAYRMQMVDEVGDYDQNFKNYGMDADYQIRMTMAGWEFGNDSVIRPHVVHEISIKTKTEPAFRICCDIDQPGIWAYLRAKWGVSQDMVINNTHLHPPYKRPFVP